MTFSCAQLSRRPHARESDSPLGHTVSGERKRKSRRHREGRQKQKRETNRRRPKPSRRTQVWRRCPARLVPVVIVIGPKKVRPYRCRINLSFWRPRESLAIWTSTFGCDCFTCACLSDIVVIGPSEGRQLNEARHIATPLSPLFSLKGLLKVRPSL